MSKHRVVVLKIVAKQLTVSQAEVEYGISRMHLYRLLARYRAGGLEALEPQSRRPASNPAATTVEVRDRNAFEYLLPLLGVRQKNGSPGHPQTQGKIERFPQTLKRWLSAQPTANTLVDLQHQLDTFRQHYNEHRPHRARDRSTPGDAYRATPKAHPAGGRDGHFRIRYDRVNADGHVSLRRAGRMHHLGIGRAHRGKRILALLDDTTATVVELETGEILSRHHIDPTRGYWRNQ